MTYKERNTAIAFIEGANEKALRTFITGLHGRRGEILHASKPRSLHKAYAQLQTIINDQARIRFANRFNQREDKEKNFEMRNPHFKFKEMSSNSNQNIRPTFSRPEQSSKFNHPESMEIEKTSTNVNVGGSNGRFNPVMKREHSKTLKVRVNNIKNINESTRLKMKSVTLRRL